MEKERESLAPDLVEYISERAEIEAQQLSEHAGAGGDIYLTGATALRRKLDYWLAGIDNRIPKGFEQYKIDYENQQDPEYQEYLRLKEKFQE